MLETVVLVWLGVLTAMNFLNPPPQTKAKPEEKIMICVRKVPSNKEDSEVIVFGCPKETSQPKESVKRPLQDKGP